MRQALFVANLYHASPRIPGLAAYLPDFGWQVVVVSPPVDPGDRQRLGLPADFLARARIVEAAYPGDVLWPWRKLLLHTGLKSTGSLTEQVKQATGASTDKSLANRLLIGYETVFGYPDTEKTWNHPAFKAACAVLEREPFNVILSSSPYPTSHIVAAKLKKRFGLPWVADFRDPWTQNHNYMYGALRRSFEERLERRVLQRADLIIAAAPEYAEKQARLLRRPVEVLTNGYFPDSVNEPPVPLTGKFTLTYTGRVYPGKQDPEKVLLVVKKLLSDEVIDGDSFEVRFYGPRQQWINEVIEKLGLGSVVRQYGQLDREDALVKQRESQVLLLLNWEDQAGKGVYPGKFFEYLAARRPVLVTGGFHSGDLECRLTETRTGVVAPTPQEIETTLRKMYNQYQKSGMVEYEGDSLEIDKYNYYHLTGRLAGLLEGTLSAQGPQLKRVNADAHQRKPGNG